MRSGAGTAFGDNLRGDAGANAIWGRGGDDWIVGRGGDDTLFGGAGADDFVFFADTGHDRIADFNTAEDRLRLSSALWGGGPHDAQSLFDQVAQVDADRTVLDFGNDNVIELTGSHDPAALVDAMLLF